MQEVLIYIFYFYVLCVEKRDMILKNMADCNIDNQKWDVIYYVHLKSKGAFTHGSKTHFMLG